MKSNKISIFSFLIFILAASAFSQPTPRNVVEAFYKFDSTHSQTFNRTNIDVRRRWFTDVLCLQFQNELKREREYLRKNPSDKPHFGDGFPFRPLDEPCRAGGVTFRYRYSVGRASARGSNATVPVTFFYPKRCELPSTTYSVRLRRVKSVWLINDLEYPDGTTLLADLLRPTY